MGRNLGIESKAELVGELLVRWLKQVTAVGEDDHGNGPAPVLDSLN